MVSLPHHTIFVGLSHNEGGDGICRFRDRTRVYYMQFLKGYYNVIS